MSSYNERLVEVLRAFENWCTKTGFKGEPVLSRVQTKQAIASLVKELVAEAKPEKPQGTIRSSDYWEGYYEAKGVFEQNLLKALEDK